MGYFVELVGLEVVLEPEERRGAAVVLDAVLDVHDVVHGPVL